MDIHAGVVAMAVSAAIAAYLSIRSAIKTMQSARKLSFYSLRRRQNASAWRLLLAGFLLIAFASWLPFYSEPVIYRYFPPSPTSSLTPTITRTPTITNTPTITLPPTLTHTPAVSHTPTLTLTPFLPLAIGALFDGPITPNPEALFTALQFSTEFDGVNSVNPRTLFELPIDTLYAGFDYNNTLPGVQWSALWYRGQQLVCYETKAWDGGTGGIGGYTECSTPINGWQAGEYEVQIFMGYEWKVVGRFRVLGSLTTPGATGTPDLSVTETPTP